ATRDRVERRRRLRDCLAGAAAELLPHMLGNEPLPRDDIERLADVLVDLRELAAATARAPARRRVNDAPARQLGREAPPRRRSPCEALNCYACRRGLPRILFRCGDQLLELQLHLIEKPKRAAMSRSKQRPPS